MAAGTASGVHRLRMQLEAVTPMFVGGADPKGKPEVRAASLRGVLRYWFRAALGGISGADLEFVRQREALLFGTSADRGSVSLLTVRARPPGVVTTWELAKDRDLGRSYLWWSMGMTGRKAVAPGTRVEVELQVWPGAYRRPTEDDSRRDEGRPPHLANLPAPGEVLSTGLLLLWLAGCLGGVGSRSRRAAGSFAVQLAAGGVPAGFPVRLQYTARTVDEAAQQLGKELQAARAWLGRTWQAPSAGASRPGEPEFDVLHPNWCSIWVVGLWSNWQQAVQDMGMAMREFRIRSKPDYRQVYDWYVSGRQIETVHRSIFGLPLPFRYSDRTTFSVVPAVGGKMLDRRASPLWLSVWKLSDDRCAGVATLFRSAFLPRQGQLRATGRPSRTASPPDSYELIEQFIRQQFRDARRVSL